MTAMLIRDGHELAVVRGGDGRVALDVCEPNGRRLAIVWLEAEECVALADRLLEPERTEVEIWAIEEAT